MNTPRTIPSEFPDYDYPQLDLAPLACEPWRNDIAPFYRWSPEYDDSVKRLELGEEELLSGCVVELLVDYLDRAKREFEDGKQFCYSVRADDGGDPLLRIDADSLDELREQLNKKAAEFGFSHLAGVDRPLSEVMLIVGAFVHEQYMRMTSCDDEQRSYGPRGGPVPGQ